MPIGVSDYYLLKEEKRNFRLTGTIIDIETIGPFQEVPRTKDQEDYFARFQKIRITAVGTLSEDRIRVFVAKGTGSLDRFGEKATVIMSRAARPLYAFNKPFEEGCYFWSSGKHLLNIENDIQMSRGESKESVVRELGLHQHNDPFHGDGSLCRAAFESGNLLEVIAHNRACLLKEYYIFRRRGTREFKTTWLD